MESVRFVKKAKSNETTGLLFKYVQGDNELEVYMPEMKLSQEAPSREGPGGVKMTIDFSAFFQASAAGAPVRIILRNKRLAYR